jgi:hypothetical protein
MAQMKRIWTMGQEIMDQVRVEYPADTFQEFEEKVMDMCAAVKESDGLNDAEYLLLREVCGF